MTTLEAGSSDFHCLCLQLYNTHTHTQIRNTCQEIYINAYRLLHMQAHSWTCQPSCKLEPLPEQILNTWTVCFSNRDKSCQTQESGTWVIGHGERVTRQGREEEEVEKKKMGHSHCHIWPHHYNLLDPVYEMNCCMYQTERQLFNLTCQMLLQQNHLRSGQRRGSYFHKILGCWLDQIICPSPSIAVLLYKAAGLDHKIAWYFS